MEEGEEREQSQLVGGGRAGPGSRLDLRRPLLGAREEDERSPLGERLVRLDDDLVLVSSPRCRWRERDEW